MSQLIPFENLIQEFQQLVQEKDLSCEEILGLLFEDGTIKKRYLSEIRRSTIIGHIANEIFRRLGKQDRVNIKALGDIDYSLELKKMWCDLNTTAIHSINTEKLIGYDINSQGEQSLRKKVLEYMGLTYKIQENDFDNIIDNMFFSYGGMDGFNTIIDTFKSIYEKEKIYFIYPEASFLAIIELAKTKLGKESLIKIKKPTSNNFFFDEQQIDQLNKLDGIKLFYITPVGNPTGEKIQKNLLETVLKTINKSENNYIILDNVYVSLLKNEISKELFEDIFQNNELKQKLIICESLSKTFGTTGIRIGRVWGFNKELFINIKKINALQKAGFSKLLGEFLENLLSNKEKLILFQNKCYDYWSNERFKFLNYLKANFAQYFDFENIPNISEREGIYLLIKIKDNYIPTQVFAKTKVIGVAIGLSDGTYIRYAFGNVK